jgi:hypothetical protein
MAVTSRIRRLEGFAEVQPQGRRMKAQARRIDQLVIPRGGNVIYHQVGHPLSPKQVHSKNN